MILIWIIVFFLICGVIGMMISHKEEKELAEFSLRYANGKECKRTDRALIPVRGDNGKWGLINRSGNVVVPYQYDSIYEEPECGGCWECHKTPSLHSPEYFSLHGDPLPKYEVEAERARAEKAREAAERQAKEAQQTAGTIDALFDAYIMFQYAEGLEEEQQAESNDD